MESAPYLTSKDINDIISQFTSSQFVVFLYPKNIM